MLLNEWKTYISSEKFNTVLHRLYGQKIEENRCRYLDLLDLFEKTFGSEGELALFSAPGRTEIGGNHTDHQHGRVLAASVDMDMIAAARITGGKEIVVRSEGFPMCTINLDQLEPFETEKNRAASLIRGVAAAFAERGCSLEGFQVAVTSDVLPGSGISSSAAFEVLIGNIINGLFYNNAADPVEIAQIGQFAENVYFGKPSGMMDQTASSVGNIITIDFKDTQNPVVKKLKFDFEQSGLALCIIDSGADHANLTNEYAAIPVEMKKICTLFGKEVLRDIPEDDFYAAIPEIRDKVGDRALLRAIHFYQDNERVARQVEALENGDTDTFLKLVRASGASSWMYLQNITPCGAKEHQEMGLALALCDKLLGTRGAYRVHGGGFAGTCQAFVPLDMLDSFKEAIDALLGKGSCHVLSIRPEGGIQITKGE